MKYSKRRREVDFQDDPDFAAALFGGETHSRSSNRQAQRKTQQFCRQVQRILNLAFEEQAGITTGLFADEVLPAPDCGRLLVYVCVPEGQSVAAALESLRDAAPQLRAEVASAVTRKRAPELSFVPVGLVGGADE